MAGKESLLAQLSALGIHPRKGLGQNFLVDPVHRGRIVAAAQLGPEDAVLEIGPGPGVLTELLLQQAGRVVAVELDDRLIPFLCARFAAYPNLSIVHGDILKLDVTGLMSDPAIAGQPPPRPATKWWPTFLTTSPAPSSRTSLKPGSRPSSPSSPCSVRWRSG
jgi:Dimethyladenosine transferase (rRNA methylation)